MCKLYRLKHIVTGLYFKPTNSSKTNLSTSGKIYSTKLNGINTLSLDGKFFMKISKSQYKKYKDIFDKFEMKSVFNRTTDYLLKSDISDFEEELL